MSFTVLAFILVGCLGAMGLFDFRITACIVAALLMGVGVIIDASGETLNVVKKSRRSHES
jgi:hypothetical protein